jgi:hypothetical protein
MMHGSVNVMDKISWTDHARNKEVLQRVKEQWNFLKKQTEGRLVGLLTYA